MAIYKSAMGKTVDMGRLTAVNERVRAVGNGKMNARGDIIDSQGRVVKPATSKVNEIYSRTVTNRSAVPQKAQSVQQAPTKQVITDADLSVLTTQETELEELMQEDAEIEKIKAAEVKKESKGKK